VRIYCKPILLIINIIIKIYLSALNFHIIYCSNPSPLSVFNSKLGGKLFSSPKDVNLNHLIYILGRPFQIQPKLVIVSIIYWVTLKNYHRQANSMLKVEDFNSEIS